MDGDAVLAGRAGREDQRRLPVIPDRSRWLNQGGWVCTGSVRGVSWGYVC